MFLEEDVRAGDDGLLDAILRAAGPAWAGELAYPLGERVVLRERVEQAFACRRGLGRRPFVVAVCGDK